MDKTKNHATVVGIDVQNEQYLARLFSMMKKRENMLIVDKKVHFNNTELRMICEIMAAKYEGKRLISTQLAKLLGITRSAVSQIVNRLEERGVVKRVDDEVDRKIAYIELSEDIVKLYREDLQQYLACVGAIVQEFGEDKFNTMCDLVEEFNTITQDKLKRAKKKA
jgi:DNA-binding MarR family transcriptional regulator